MSEHVDLRDLMNAHRWDEQDIDDVSVVIRFRGMPDDELTVAGSAIGAIHSGGFTVQDSSGEEGFYPWHRVLRILDADGRVEWERGE